MSLIDILIVVGGGLLYLFCWRVAFRWGLRDSHKLDEIDGIDWGDLIFQGLFMFIFALPLCVSLSFKFIGRQLDDNGLSSTKIAKSIYYTRAEKKAMRITK